MNQTDEKEELGKSIVYLENVKLLMNYLIHERNLFWERYNIYLGLNSGLIVALTFLLKENITSFLRVGLLSISVIGLGSSFVWFLITNRTHAFHRHWIRLIRDIEEQHLQELTIFRKEEELKEKLKFYEKIPIHIISPMVPLLFTILWSFLLFWVLVIIY
ncbi:MAG: hypothetical protein QXR45_12295 [Candidatus Bathyarchaeia archaeon]